MQALLDKWDLISDFTSLASLCHTQDKKILHKKKCPALWWERAPTFIYTNSYSTSLLEHNFDALLMQCISSQLSVLFCLFTVYINEHFFNIAAYFYMHLYSCTTNKETAIANLLLMFQMFPEDNYFVQMSCTIQIVPLFCDCLYLRKVMFTRYWKLWSVHPEGAIIQIT